MTDPSPTDDATNPALPLMAKPTELAICIAMFNSWGDRDGWQPADTIRGQLVKLGFDCSAQQLAAWLKRMSRVDAPWVEVREGPFGQRDRQYRLTRFGRTDVQNRCPGLSPYTPWLTTMHVSEATSTVNTRSPFGI